MRFEDGIKNALEDYSAPYNSADWTQLEKKLDAGSGKSRYSSVLFYGALIVAALTFSGVLYYMDVEESSLTENNHEQSNNPAIANVDDGSTLPPVAGIDQTEGSSNSGEAIRRTGHFSLGVTHDTDIEAENSKSVNPDNLLPEESNAKSNSVSKVSNRELAQNNLGKSINSAPVPNDRGNDSGSAQHRNSDQESATGFSTNISEGCPGTKIDFAAQDMSESGIYLWNFGDGSFSNKPTPEHAFDKPGMYDVTLSVTSLESGAIRSAPATDRIIIHDAPYSDFSWDKKVENNEIPTMHFENTSRSGVQWKWDLGDGTTSRESHPEHIYKKKGTYQVTLVATNALGCQDKVTKMVEVTNDYKLLAPNTFSPNSDGTNDKFIPEALKILDAHFKMSIFEPKTGRLIYETKEATAAWNGRVNNKGMACEKGEYVWVVDIEDGFNAQETYNGKVTLLR